MTRQLIEHQVNPANTRLRITADEPGAGGASHFYEVRILDENGEVDEGFDPHELVFQNGPIGEVGVNGITHEALLAIIADRLRSFQQGPYRCRHNALALTAIEEAQNWLNRRTRERELRGVEGTHEV